MGTSLPWLLHSFVSGLPNNEGAELNRRPNRRQPRDSGHDHSHYIALFVDRPFTAAVAHDWTLGISLHESTEHRLAIC